MGQTLVVKIGGSLALRGAHILSILSREGCRALVVPGGGRFADHVRSLSPSPDAAHWMAIAGMDQFGWLLASNGYPVTTRVANVNEVTILLPYCTLMVADPLPHTWEVTSDTIAAWVAHRLMLDLLILKSVDGIMGEDGIIPFIDHSVPTGVVDPACIPYVLTQGVKTLIESGVYDDCIVAGIRGHRTRGTRIGTTI